jgi:V/A-type H+/Na+-transporting ATPase subunit I
MIVPMKRLTLVCLTSDRPSAMYQLRDLGVVHVTDRRPPTGEELDELRARLAGEQRALAALPAGGGARGVDGAEASGGVALEAGAVVEEVLRLLDRRDELAVRAAELRRELARYAPFGEFDLEEVLALERAGVWTALAVAPPDELPTPGGVTVTELGRDRGASYVLLASSGGAPEPADDPGAGFERVPWPERPLAAVRDELSAAEVEDDAATTRLAELAAVRAAVADRAAQTADAVRLCEARDGMEDAGELSVLSGYVPSPQQEAVRGAAAAHGWGVLFSDPSPGEDVPVLLSQSRFVRPVLTVFDFLHIYPGYWEADPGWVFLPFFSLFFAMIVGDAGYGILLLALAAVLQWRLKRVPRHMFAMMYIVGAATVFWGVVMGSYFGFSGPAPLAGLQIAWLKDRDNLIDLCFFIGAVHLSFAHVWNLTSLVRERSWFRVPCQAGWLMVVWSMFFLARQAVLGRTMPSFLLYTLLAGIVLVAAFMKTPREVKAEWIDHAMLPLTMIGSFVDILSYIRLFAVGYAGVAVLAAFNDMAAGIGFGSVPAAIAASLLLLFANALNIVLAGLGVLVHAVRLNTLEFSTHKGLAWQGYTRYTPFARRRRAA